MSFIVPAHDEERLIGRTLEALQAAASAVTESFEIIVVDDASTDRTAEIARCRGARVVSVNLRHIAAVRNAGAAAARGERFIFVDADTFVDQAVISAALRAMDDGAVGGGAIVEWEGERPRWAMVAEVITAVWLRVGKLAAGCFIFCTRPAFEATGGFDERVYASEELFLSRALKRQGRFVVLREPVVTSGRKFRTYSLGEVLRMGLGLGWRPWRALRDRRRLALWYGQRRHDD